MLLLGLPEHGSLEYLTGLVCRVHLHWIFLGSHGFNCKLSNSAHPPCPLSSPLFQSLSLGYVDSGTSHAEQGNERKEDYDFGICIWHK